MCATRARTSNLRDAVENLGLAFDIPVDGEDVYVIHGFAQHFALDPKASMHRLRDEYPHRSGEDEIPWGEAQWVGGNHMALRYRGNVLTRTKMWFQESDPMENVKGFLKYFYTGWQYKVMPATAGVEKVPWLAEFTNRVNNWLVGFGQLWTNHHIVTMYEKEDCGIGMHYDKPKSIDPNSVILVIKTGDCGRPFRITDNRGGADQDKELFNAVVAPGDAVLMSMKSNLATKHGVPIVTQSMGMSGSIVMRTINEWVSREQLQKELRRRGVVRPRDEDNDLTAEDLFGPSDEELNEEDAAEQFWAGEL